MILKVLHDLDSQVEIMLGVAEDKFAYILTLVGAFFNDVTVILEQMINEETIEFLMGAGLVFVDFAGKSLAEDQSVHKAARDRLKLAKKHEKISVENCKFISTLIQRLDYQFDLKISIKSVIILHPS